MSFITDQLILLDVTITNPKEAIQTAGQLLEQEQKATAEYTSAMIKTWEQLGAYMVIAPSIALPHARPEHGALETSLSIVRLQKPIPFGHPNNDPVHLVCAFVAVNHQEHICLLQKIARIFNNTHHLSQVKQAQQKQGILSLFSISS